MHNSTGRECERSRRRLFKRAIELSKEEGALTLPIAEALHLGNSEWKTFLAADSLATTVSTVKSYAVIPFVCTIPSLITFSKIMSEDN